MTIRLTKSVVRSVISPAVTLLVLNLAALVWIDRAGLTSRLGSMGGLLPVWFDASQVPHHRVIAMVAMIVVGIVAAFGRWPRRGAGALFVASIVSTALAVATMRLLAEGILATGPIYVFGLFAICALGVSQFLIAMVALMEGRKRYLRPLLVIAAIVWTAVLVEGVFRLQVPLDMYELVPDRWTEGAAFERDPTGRLIGRPGFRGEYRHPEFPGVRVEFNARGYRDGLDELYPPRPGDDVVLVLGDSLAFGCGVELVDTFHEQLEGRREGLQVISLAVPGYGQVQELRVLEEAGQTIAPDVIVVALYEGNDFADNLSAGARMVGITPQFRELPKLRRPRYEEFLHGIRGAAFWFGSSSTLQVIRPRIDDWLVARGWVQRLVPTNRLLNMMMSTSLDDGKTLQLGIAVHWTNALLDRIRAKADALGARLAVLMIPAAIQVSPRRYADFVASRPEEQRPTLSRVRFHNEYVAALRERGFMVIDPMEELARESSKGTDAYFHEGHWNKVGHTIAADQIASHLDEWFGSR